MLDWKGLVKCSGLLSGVGQTFCSSGGIGKTFWITERDWSKFLWEWAGLVKHFCISGRDQTFCRSDWLNNSVLVVGIDQTFCECGRD